MRKGQRKEEKDAKDFKGRRTPKSGGFWSFQGDVRTENFLIDSKETDKKSFSITEGIWEKLFNEALKARKTPLLSISLTSYDIDLVVMDKDDFLTLFGGKNGKEKTSG